MAAQFAGSQRRPPHCHGKLRTSPRFRPVRHWRPGRPGWSSRRPRRRPRSIRPSLRLSPPSPRHPPRPGATWPSPCLSLQARPRLVVRGLRLRSPRLLRRRQRQPLPRCICRRRPHRRPPQRTSRPVRLRLRRRHLSPHPPQSRLRRLPGPCARPRRAADAPRHPRRRPRPQRHRPRRRARRHPPRHRPRLLGPLRPLRPRRLPPPSPRRPPLQSLRRPPAILRPLSEGHMARTRRRPVSTISPRRASTA